jgi:hypothetical protein
VLRVDQGEPHAYQVVVVRSAVRAYWDDALAFARPHLEGIDRAALDAQRAR